MRSVQASKNAGASLISQIIVLLIGFATRTAFIYTLSSTFLGISGLFQSVLVILNVSELGIGTSIIYALYKPLAENDHEKIKSLMSFYKKAYLLIGFIVLVIGLSLLPFLDHIIKEEIEVVNIRIVFVLYIIESVSSYWICGYKRAILQASQREYIITKYNAIVRIVAEVFRFSLLFILKNHPEYSFYTYLSVGIIYQTVVNIVISHKSNQLFECLKEKNVVPIDKKDKKDIMKNVVGASVSKVSGVMINSIDNILISAFLGITVVGVYSNYLTLKSYLILPLTIIFGSMAAGIGDFCAIESLDNQKKLFKNLQFAYFWIYGFASIGFFIMCNPFIRTIWLRDDQYLLEENTVLIISLIIMLDGLAGAVISFRDANGLYWRTKYRYLFSALLNFVISFVLVKYIGINGVLIGTLASVIILVLFDPIILFKYVFHEKPFKYYLSYFGFLLLIASTGLLIWFISRFFAEYTITNFIIRLAFCIFIPNVLWLLIFRKDSRFINVKTKIMSLVRHITKRSAENE